MRKRNYQVYGLYCVCGCEPEEIIRYVGQSALGARDRFNKHKHSARNDKPWPVCRWMRKHGVENIRYTVLETLSSAYETDESEAKWIGQLGTLIGESGYNIRPGGDSVRGYTHAPWAKSRMTHSVSQVTRDKISRSLTGAFTGESSGNVKTTQEQAEEVIQRYWSGETRTQISREMGLLESTVSGIASGQAWKYLPRPTTPRVVKTSGKFSPGTQPSCTKLTESQVREIRARYDAGERPRDLGPDYGVTPENVSQIGKRKTWKHIE